MQSVRTKIMSKTSPLRLMSYKSEVTNRSKSISGEGFDILTVGTYNPAAVALQRAIGDYVQGIYESLYLETRITAERQVTVEVA